MSGAIASGEVRTRGHKVLTLFRRSLRPAALALVSLGSILAVWQFSSGRLLNAMLFPPPSVVFAELASMTRSGEVFVHVFASLQRILAGYVAGCVVGVVLGVMIGRIRLVRELFDPILQLIRPVSAVAMIPFAIIWFGIDEFSRYFIVFYATIFAVIFNTIAGVSTVPLSRTRAAHCLGASRSVVLFRVILPSALPYVLTGMRTALGFSFMGIVAAEMVAGQSGIGYLIMQSRLMIQPERVFVGVIALAVIGMLADLLFRYVVDRTMKCYMQYLYQV